MAEPAARRSRGRERLQARLERLVADNRFTVAVVFPVVGAVLLPLSAADPAWLPEALRFNPYLILLGTVVMRLPLIAGLAPLVDRRGALALGALVAYAYAIETIGVTTGWPYGEFAYGVALGPTLGGVPLGLPVFFVPLVANAYLLCLLLLGDRAANLAVRLSAVVAAVLAVDLVLDPAAVALGFWEYGAGGVYYDVPLSNYRGWVLSAVVSVVLMDRAFDRRAVVERVRSCEFALDDLVSFVLLWGAINAWFGNAVPVVVAGLFFVGLVRIDRFDFAVADAVPAVLSGRGT